MSTDTTSGSLSGVNVLLMGPSGTGKTYSIGTLVDSGLEVFYLGLENGLESLLGYYKDRGLPIPENLHWAIVEGPTASFNELLDIARKVNQFSFESLTKLSDNNRTKHDTFIKLLSTLNEFHDQRFNKSFGAVNTWGPDKVLVIDGMTGICNAALSLVVGGKPVRSQADWGLAQNQVETLLRLLCDGCKCHFVLIAHVERETDQVLGGIKIMVQTLGKALAPKIPAMFSDVVLTARAGSKWSWDTGSGQADVKTRNLPIANDIQPTFKTIVDSWRKRSMT